MNASTDETAAGQTGEPAGGLVTATPAAEDLTDAAPEPASVSAHSQVEEKKARIESDRRGFWICSATQIRPPGPGQQGIEPSCDDQACDQVAFVMPVGPVYHISPFPGFGKNRSLGNIVTECECSG